MAYSLTINSINVSDYVTNCGDISMIKKNKDFSLVAPDLDLVVSAKINSLTTLSVGDEVYIYRDSQVIYAGVIDKIKFVEDNLTYKINVIHIISVLKESATDSSFKTVMNSYKTTKTINSDTHEIISMVQLFNAIFSIIGYTLDWTTYFHEYIVLWKGNTQNLGSTEVIYGSGSGITLGSVNYSDLYYMPNQILCINQNNVYEPSWLNSVEGNSNKLSIFDLLSFLCSIHGFSFMIKSTSEFYVLNSVNNFSFTDNQLKFYDETEEFGDIFGILVSQQTLNPESVMNYNSAWFPYADNQAYYYDSSAQYNGSNLNSFLVPTLTHGYGNKPTNIDCYNHINPIILKIDATYGHRAWIVFPYVNDTLGNMMTNKINAIEKNYLVQELNVEFTDLGSNIYPVDELTIIDIKKDLVKIIQREEIV